jgi:hypothetical protein
MAMNENDLLIRVPENEFDKLLQREQVLSDVEQNLKPWINLMRDLVNYGTNLIPRCFGSSPRSLADAVVLGILLRQFVAMLDGAEVLLSNGAVHAAKLQMRALFESTVYIHWILLGDAEKKCDYYYVHNLLRKRLWAERAQGTSAVGQQFIAIMNTIGVQQSQEAAAAAAQQLPEIDRVLGLPKFALINADFDSRKGRKNDVNWYVPLGPRTLRAVSESIGKQAEYVLIYSGGSEVMHGSNYDHHVEFTTGRITFSPIRYLKDFGWVYHYSATLTLGMYRRILEAYRAGEIPSFNRKYMEKWRKDFMNVPNVTINSIETTI